MARVKTKSVSTIIIDSVKPEKAESEKSTKKSIEKTKTPNY